MHINISHCHIIKQLFSTLPYIFASPHVFFHPLLAVWLQHRCFWSLIIRWLLPRAPTRPWFVTEQLSMSHIFIQGFQPPPRCSWQLYSSVVTPEAPGPSEGTVPQNLTPYLLYSAFNQSSLETIISTSTTCLVVSAPVSEWCLDNGWGLQSTQVFFFLPQSVSSWNRLIISCCDQKAEPPCCNRVWWEHHSRKNIFHLSGNKANSEPLKGTQFWDLC